MGTDTGSASGTGVWSGWGGRRPRFKPAAAVVIIATMVGAGCGSTPGTGRAAAGGGGGGGGTKLAVVAGENEYGDVAAQIGRPYVSVYSVDSNPNTDPHTYEATPGVAHKIAQAKLLIENGVGYDDFMARLASASSNPDRKVIDVQQLLKLPDSTANPHLWYDPKTMPAVAQAMVRDLSELDPAHAGEFQANGARFVGSLQPWLDSVASFRARYPGTKSATTEPVADYLLSAMGIDNLTPFGFQADIMNGTDPSPQDVSLEKRFFTDHQAKVFCYNQQVTNALTGSIRQSAIAAGVPVVGVYETLPSGYDYQSWMLAETAAIEKAVATGASTEHL